MPGGSTTSTGDRALPPSNQGSKPSTSRATTHTRGRPVSSCAPGQWLIQLAMMDHQARQLMNGQQQKGQQEDSQPGHTKACHRNGAAATAASKARPPKGWKTLLPGPANDPGTSLEQPPRGEAVRISPTVAGALSKNQSIGPNPGATATCR